MGTHIHKLNAKKGAAIFTGGNIMVETDEEVIDVVVFIFLFFLSIVKNLNLKVHTPLKNWLRQQKKGKTPAHEKRESVFEPRSGIIK